MNFAQRFQCHIYTTISITILQRFLRFFYNELQYNDFCTGLQWFSYVFLQRFAETMVFCLFTMILSLLTLIPATQRFSIQKIQRFYFLFYNDFQIGANNGRIVVSNA